MSRSKKIFVAFAIVFLLFLVYVSYDISTRTTFPGSNPPSETLPNRTSLRDSLSTDSARTDTLP